MRLRPLLKPCTLRLVSLGAGGVLSLKAPSVQPGHGQKLLMCPRPLLESSGFLPGVG